MSDSRGAQHKDSWDKFKILTTALIPLILGVIGWQVNVSLKERDVRLRTVELAIGILQKDPQKAPETPVLRKWAIEVIDQLSEVPLAEKAKQELLEKPLPRGFSKGFSRGFSQ